MRMYFIAILLPEELNFRIKTYKQKMLENFGCKVALRSPAHITIIPPFWMDPEQLPELANDTDVIAAQFTEFDLKLNGISSFPPKTIFVGVEESIPLNALHQKVNTFFRDRGSYKMKWDSRPFHPHITIATRDLHKKAYAESMELLKGVKFDHEWSVNRIHILEHKNAPWEVVHQSVLKK